MILELNNIIFAWFPRPVFWGGPEPDFRFTFKKDWMIEANILSNLQPNASQGLAHRASRRQ